MFGGKNNRTVTIDSSVYEAEAEERRRRELDDLTQANRRRQLAFDTQRNDAEQRRRQLEVDEGRANLEQRDRQLAAQQNAQTVWAVRRNGLRDQIAHLQGALSGAEGRMHSSDMDIAVRAASEADVFRMRLSEAQNAYAAHMTTQPL